MPMVIEASPAPGSPVVSNDTALAHARLTRRVLLGAAAGVATLHAHAAAPHPQLDAAWSTAQGRLHRVGRLRLATRVEVIASIDVPTRAHGLLRLDDGTLIVVARRPGDWMLLWHAATGLTRMHWNTPGRVFNGHARVHQGKLYTTETDLESGLGVVVQLDLRSVQEHARPLPSARTAARSARRSPDDPVVVWPTHGRDPHDLGFDRDGLLWVANGGITTDAATGRVKDTRTMDSSLVCLDAGNGARLGQWRLADRKLSLRHLALGGDGRIGIALQAEHDSAADRGAAPVLAVWEHGRLDIVPGGAASGYGGDIAVFDEGFAVSATRAGRVDAWHPVKGWSTLGVADEPCALASIRGLLWYGAPQRWSSVTAGHAWAAPGLRFDNHAAAA